MAFISKDKVYKDFDVLNISVQNLFNTKTYSVDMDPITFVNGITSPDPVDPEQFRPVTPGNIYKNNKDKIDWILKVLSIILVVVILIVFRKPIIAFIKYCFEGIKEVCKKISPYVKSGFEKIGSWMKDFIDKIRSMIKRK